MTEKKIRLNIVMVVMTVLGMVLFLISYTTGYYMFGQMNSIAILLSILAALIIELTGIYVQEQQLARLSRKIFFHRKADAYVWEQEWPYILVTVMIILLCSAVGMLLTDRVEAVGTCIVTDFDAGHGGEAAVYVSLAAIAFFLITVFLGIIKNFLSGKNGEVMAENEN